MDTVRDALEKEGINHSIREHKDTAYDGLFILQKGYATFFVREEERDRAAAIIKQIKGLPYVVYSKD